MVIDVDIIQDVEVLLKNLNGYELLSYAICNEECAVETYEWLAEKIGGEIGTELRLLAGERRKHALQLRELFKKLYPNAKPLEFNAPPLDTLPLCRELMRAKNLRDALAIALLSEAIGRDVYRKLQRMTGNEVGELFGRLAEMKEEAYRRLLKLYETLD
jgi:rubrerythrin